MNSSTSLLFIFATIIVALAIVDAQCTSTAEYCWSCSNSTTNANTTYKQNLNTLLASLSSNNQTDYGFLNLSLGTGTNKVNVIAFCRGDLAQDQCRSCYGEANIILSQKCSNHYQAIIWALGCTVRYSIIITMFGIEEDKPVRLLASPNSASNPEYFKLVLNPLLETLTQNASSGDSMKKFAAGHAFVPAGSETNQTIFATTQCSPDLDEQNCSECLEDSIKDIPTCCEGTNGGRVLKPSCTLRYEKGIFYDPSADSLINISIATPPPTATPSPTATKGIGDFSFANLLFRTSKNDTQF
ncbi:putative Gnk2-like domain-containing protein [Rosa chinensis]|uniref:Putative Gnk2-like domain-containing protein n=1 Tax=Rosa chinensis TaxID=74649 RepID=A0A2P6PPD0_ROSCH|nr:cysteine-rich repeat secretory protein 38 [Rosa chinensis]PRQ23788.1 putative Gnk2-like domain-containing protein [Rosa chinensis]